MTRSPKKPEPEIGERYAILYTDGSLNIATAKTSRTEKSARQWFDVNTSDEGDRLCLLMIKPIHVFEPDPKSATDELLAAAETVLGGLDKRLDVAPSTSKPVFNGIAELHAAIVRFKREARAS